MRLCNPMPQPGIAGQPSNDKTGQNALASCRSADSDLPGTLLWIGSRDAIEFQDAYRYCEAHVGQLAFRTDLTAALARPATQVDRIVVARDSRRAIAEDRWRALTAAYPTASTLQLQGPLFEGHRGVAIETSIDCRWHQWPSVLVPWLWPDRPEQAGCQVRCRGSVAVITSLAAAAEPLMELACSAGATAIWCRQPHALQVRNMDAVWWDDSVAFPASRQVWRERLNRCGAGRKCHHVWLVGGPRHEAYQDALAAGVHLTLAKPFSFEHLAGTLERLGAGVSGEPTRNALSAA